MGHISIKFADAGNTTSWLLVRYAKLSAPTAYIGLPFAYQPPHPERGLTIENLDPVMYRVEFWRSSDGVTFETFQLKLDVDASKGAVDWFVYNYVVGRQDGSATAPVWRDPFDGEFSVTDERLKGSKWYIEQRGVGKLRPDEVTMDSTTGTWTLASGAFNDKDTYFAVLEKTVTSQEQQQQIDNTGDDYVVEIVLNGGETFSALTHHKKLLSANYSTTIGVLTIPAFASIPDKTKTRIVHHQGTSRYLKIQFPGPVWFKGKQRDKIYLSKGEEIELLFNAATARVIGHYAPGYDTLGKEELVRKLSINAMLADGGGPYQIADYPRLYEDFIDELPNEQIMTVAQWNEQRVIDGESVYVNRGKWMVDTSTNTFRPPDLRGVHRKAMTLNDTLDRIDGDIAGNLQWESVGKHNHGLPISAETLGSAYYGVKLLSQNVQLEDFHFGLNYNRVHLTETVGGRAEVRNIGYIPQILY